MPSNGAYTVTHNNDVVFVSGVSLDLQDRIFTSIGNHPNIPVTWHYEMVELQDNRILLFGGRTGDYPSNVEISNETWIYTE